MSDSLADWIAPKRTALLIIDMQVDFASPDGVLGRAGVDLSAVPAALAAAERLALAARAARLPVIFAGLQTSEGADSAAWSEWMRRRGQAAGEPLCREGQPGAAFVGPQPRAGERVIAKQRYSAFFGTDLHAVLKTLGVDTLVLCGLTTECCIDGAASDAFNLDYQVFIASDACAAYEPDLHQAALKALALNCAIVVDTEAVMAAWRPPA